MHKAKNALRDDYDTSTEGRKRGKKGKKAWKKAAKELSTKKAVRSFCPSSSSLLSSSSSLKIGPEEQKQRREQEQPVDTVRRAEERGVLESDSHDMIDATLYV